MDSPSLVLQLILNPGFLRTLCYQTVYIKFREIIERVLKNRSLLYVHVLSQLVTYSDTHAYIFINLMYMYMCIHV